MPRIMVTGAAGQLGSALVNGLLARGEWDVVGVDNLLSGRKELVPANSNNYQFIQANCNNPLEISQVMLGHRFDYVFHYAAVVGVQRTLDDPISVLEDIRGFENILALCKNTRVSRVFFSSSSEVYGEPVEIPQREHQTPLNSRLPYAVVKNVGECYLRSFHQTYGLEYTVFRFFNTYGPNQSYDFVVPRFMINAIHGQDLTIYGDGSQSRTFCYVDDNVDACLNCMTQDLFVNDTLNVGSEKMFTIAQLAEIVIAEVNSTSKIQYVSALEEGDMKRRQPESSKMQQALGRDLLPLQGGIQRMLNDERFMKYASETDKRRGWT